ncbi:MAG: aspartate-semialdehyde dehydrogenase [Clostridia bacterium]|nr:aspartate-semialdehyde dehydrogenase [Clostridia bacterium]
MKNTYNIAIVGASGLVGRTILKVLEEKNIESANYFLFSSKKSAGTSVNFLGKSYIFQELTENSFEYNFDFAIFSAGSEIAKKYAPIAVSKGCTVIDNSNAFRMNPDVPLIVPEVNIDRVFKNNGIISNPNCSTIQAVLPLKILDKKYSIKRIVYSTYQAVSGAGKQGISDLENGMKGISPQKFPYPIFNNCIPHIDIFMDDGYSKEEHKMINETRKILEKPNLPITATTVRVPVFNCHCESINVEFEKKFNLYDIRNSLQNSPGIILMDDLEKNKYPIPTIVNGNDEVYVGRIRQDFSVYSGLNLWVVADNLRKGAASNAVQILEYLILKKEQ